MLPTVFRAGQTGGVEETKEGTGRLSLGETSEARLAGDEGDAGAGTQVGTPAKGGEKVCCRYSELVTIVATES
jgi:hypothetical protein